MKKILLPVFVGIVLLSMYASAGDKPGATPEWSINATAIEACSCPMFCQCYFNTQPAAHDHHGAKKHFCKANIAFKVNKGHYGPVKLDGLKFWITDDLGGDFSQGKMDWTILTFDKSMTKEQRDAVVFMHKQLFPVQWNSFETAEGVIDKWEFNGETAVATLDGGKSGEIRLKRFPGMTTEPVVIRNLKYFGVPRNDGFVLMPNEIEAYRIGPKAFEYKGTNGFMITVDMNSKDVAGAAAASH